MAIIKVDKKMTFLQRGQIKLCISKTMELLGKGKHEYRKLFLNSKAFKMYFDSRKFHLVFVTKEDKEYDFWLYDAPHSRKVIELFKQELSLNILGNKLKSKLHQEITTDMSITIKEGLK